MFNQIKQFYNSFLRVRLRYQKETNMCYVNIPKSGCTTLKRGMFLAAGNKCYTNKAQFDASPGGFLYKKEDLEKYVNDDTYIYTVVRNPLVRIFSAYWDKVCGGGDLTNRKLKQVVRVFGNKYVSFSEFLEYIGSIKDEARDPYFRSMSSQSLYGQIKYDYIGCLEDGDSLRKIECELLKRSGYKGKLFVNKNSQGSKDKINYVSQSEFEKVVSIFNEDFDNFGYDNLS